MPNKAQTGRHKRWLLVGALFASVVLNLFLVGLVAGVIPACKHRHFAPMELASSHGEFLVDGMTRYLSQTDAQAFHEVVEAQTQALKQAHEHVRQATKDVASVFEQDPQDQAALQTALDQWAQAKAEAGAIVKQVVQDSYSKLSADGRHRLAELTR